MLAYTIQRTLRDGFPRLDDLKVGQSFVLLELLEDKSLRVAEIILRQVNALEQGVELHMFIVFSSDSGALPPGQAIKRQLVDQDLAQNWTLAPMKHV